jgi:hypothetical protein
MFETCAATCPTFDAGASEIGNRNPIRPTDSERPRISDREGHFPFPSVGALNPRDRGWRIQVRELGTGEALIEAFARSYLQSGLAQWGVMYIDGHFMPYYGLYPITKGWHGVRAVAMKGSYNFLVVDERFCPWPFLIRSSSEELLQKIPELIEKAKRLAEQAGVSPERLDKLIVVFDPTHEGLPLRKATWSDGHSSVGIDGATARRNCGDSIFEGPIWSANPLVSVSTRPPASHVSRFVDTSIW